MKKGIYIYGIVPNFYATTQFQSLENSGVYTISFDNISAIVSDRESNQLDFSDKESLGHLLVHHQKTIETLMGKGFAMLIPMRLGTIVSTKNEVIKILSTGYELIFNTLKKIEFLSEIDLAVTWDNFSEVLTEISVHPEIIALKNEIFSKSETLTQLDQVKVGMLIQQKLEEKNKAIELRILDELSPLSIDIKIHDVMDDQMVSNAAFLIHSNKKEKFEHAIDSLDEQFQSSLKFKLVGPLPCYSFYTLEVKGLNLEAVEQAGLELGLKEITSETEIKKAYLENARLFHPDAHPAGGHEDSFNRINAAYHTILDYVAAARQTSKEDAIQLSRERLIENLILVKIKD
ncbi:MAG: GvpL/GvpF family gas vesicle protein [Bacteroidota bacterium]